MKNILKTFGLFIVLSVIFSGLSACSNTANSQKGPVDEKAETNSANAAANTATASAENKSSDYPPIPAGVAPADVKNLDGNVYKVQDFKGKVVLLNLWATWCGPCRQEMPELIAMEDEHKAKDFKIIGLNVDEETPEQIKEFAEKMKLNYELAWTDENLYRELMKVSKFSGIPQSFLIDRDGHLRGVFLGGSKKVVAQMKENVEKVVNE